MFLYKPKKCLLDIVESNFSITYFIYIQIYYLGLVSIGNVFFFFTFIN